MLLPCLMATAPSFDLHGGRFLSGWREVMPRFLAQKVVPGYPCHACEKRFICGVCPAQSEMETGSVFRNPQYMCELGEARCGALARPVAGRADKG
jgi:radical SAM protein with 4Fe4S-binding SPASM domain